MRVSFDLKKEYGVFLIIILGIGAVIAYGGTDAAVMGHDGLEVNIDDGTGAIGLDTYATAAKARLDVQQSDILANALDIGTIQTNVASHSASITGHETRIGVLESAGSGSLNCNTVSATVSPGGTIITATCVTGTLTGGGCVVPTSGQTNEYISSTPNLAETGWTCLSKIWIAEMAARARCCSIS